MISSVPPLLRVMRQTRQRAGSEKPCSSVEKAATNPLRSFDQRVGTAEVLEQVFASIEENKDGGLGWVWHQGPPIADRDTLGKLAYRLEMAC